VKILGANRLAKRERDVVVGYDDEGNAVTLRVQAMRLGLIDDIEEEIPYPEPPLGPVVRDRRQVVVRDETGKPVRKEMVDDPAFLVERSRIEELRGIASVYYCVISGQIEFEAEKKDDWPSRTAFFRQVRKEMDEGGIKQGALNAMLIAINELSSIDNIEVEEARDALKPKDERGNPSGP